MKDVDKFFFFFFVVSLLILKLTKLFKSLKKNIAKNNEIELFSFFFFEIYK